MCGIECMICTCTVHVQLFISSTEQQFGVHHLQAQDHVACLAVSQVLEDSGTELGLLGR